MQGRTGNRHCVQADSSRGGIRRVVAGKVIAEGLSVSDSTVQRTRRGKRIFSPSLPASESFAIAQPEPVCAVCGKKILEIESSFAIGKGFEDATSGVSVEKGDGVASRLCHFDCAIGLVKGKHDVKPPYRLSYVGSGKFAIFKFTGRKGEFSISETIAFENTEDFKAVQEYVQGLKK